MKIAIRGHESRGKEVIQILESLGGINASNYSGSNFASYYELHGNSIICMSKKSENFKYYTLEEFETEFPFKVGDRVESLTTGLIGTITKFFENGIYYFKYDNGICSFAAAKYLKLYKEMKEERNITLALDKAKEWYNKGGELKEVALQAYSKEELTKVELPKTWEEFCDNYPVEENEAMIGCDASIINCKGIEGKRSYKFKDIIPSKKSAEAHLAMIQLEQLRDCWRQGWKPIWGIFEKWCIHLYRNELSIGITTNTSRFLTFPTKEMAEEFLKCFRDLIEKAGDLI